MARIYDFSVAEDHIAIDHSYFVHDTLSAGALDPSHFDVGKHAADASDRLIYDSGSGALYFDSDGTGAAAQVKIAVLTPGLALTATDFEVL